VETRKRLEESTVVRILALADDVAAHDGVAALSEQTLLDLRTPVREVRHLLIRPPGEPGAAGADAVAGYAQIDADGSSAELAVHPAYRCHGLGRALLDEVRTLAAGVAVWAHGDLPAARSLAAAAGMGKVRELLQMAADLPAAGVTTSTAPSDHGLPPEQVRTFRPGKDEDAWVRLNARAFADHPEQGRMTVDDLRARQSEDWFDPSLLWLVSDETGGAAADELAASMWVKVLPGESSGEIYALGVDPSAQGRGLGGGLTSLALAELTARGLDRATLYVEGDNTAALRTYEKKGFVCVGTDVQYR